MQFCKEKNQKQIHKQTEQLPSSIMTNKTITKENGNNNMDDLDDMEYERDGEDTKTFQNVRVKPGKDRKRRAGTLREGEIISSLDIMGANKL